VEALRDHRTFFSSKISDMLLTSYLRQPERRTNNNSSEPSTEPTGRSRLTAREREIVQLLAEGKSNKEVAQMLNISIKTAETHRTNIMNKLDLRSITELVRYAVRNNIVEP
jgi:DNA-binding NarL/FixJ family response regulator